MNNLAAPFCRPAFGSFAMLADAAGALPQEATPLLLPDATPPQEMDLSVIRTGTILANAAQAFVGGRRDDHRRFGLYAVLVRHPRGHLLIDAGAARDVSPHLAQLPWVMRKATRFRQDVSAAAQLRDGGLDPATLTAIVLTHAHWDHVSGAADFGPLPVWLSAAEASFMQSGNRAMKVANSIAGMVTRAIEFDGGPYLGFEASHDLWGDGSVVIVPAPGHTPGSVIVFVCLPGGRRIAFIGDIVWQMEGVERQVPRPWLSRLLADYAPAEVLRLIRRLARLRQALPELWMVPAHDERMMGRLPQWPATTASAGSPDGGT